MKLVKYRFDVGNTKMFSFAKRNDGEVAEAMKAAAAAILLDYWIDFSEGHISAYRLADLIYDAMREADCTKKAER